MKPGSIRGGARGTLANIVHARMTVRRRRERAEETDSHPDQPLQRGRGLLGEKLPQLLILARVEGSVRGLDVGDELID
jgi:hypothetical protein